MPYIPHTILEKKRFFTIFRQMTEMENTSALEALVKLQTDRGMDAATAEANARHCIAAVALRETVFEQLSDDALGTMNHFFEKLAKKDPGERMASLYLILFGLTIHNDPNFTGGEDLEPLVRNFIDRQAPGGKHPTPEVLEDRIRQAMGQFPIPPAAMKKFARALKKKDCRLATALALGESGRNLKCLMTMELWLKQEGAISLEEAANAACAGTDYQAAADAVTCGYLTRDAAKKILFVLSLVALIIAVFYLTGSVERLLLAYEHIGVAAPVSTVSSGMSGRTLINYGTIHRNSFLHTSGDYLFAGIADAIQGFLALFASEFLSGKRAADLVGAAGSWLSGLFRKNDGTETLENLADAVAPETSAAPRDDADIWAAARAARDAIAGDEDDEPVYF